MDFSDVNFALETSRNPGLSFFTPLESPFVCLVNFSIEMSCGGLPGSVPNQRNGPSFKLAGSKKIHITHQLGFCVSFKLTFTLARFAPVCDAFNCMCRRIERPSSEPDLHSIARS